MDWQDIKVSGISISLKSTTLANDFRKGRSINTHTLSGIRWITGEKLLPFGHLVRRVDSLEKTLMLGGLGAGGEEDDRGWDCWMASLTRWMWVWVNSRSWWWTGRSGVLQFMGSQRVGQDWAAELKWTDWTLCKTDHIFTCLFDICIPLFVCKLPICIFACVCKC